MRLVGVCLLGFGIVLLVPEAIFLANARSLPEVLAAVVCGAAIPLPMIIGGIALIRQEEDKGRRSPQPDTPHPPTPKYVNRANPVGDVLDRVRNFDLNRLNWIGWLLLLSTFGFVVGEAALLVLWVGDVGPRKNGLMNVIAVPMTFLAIGFFFGVRWMLKKFGVSIYRE